VNLKQWVACVAVAFITGCTTTPQGKAIDRANYADIASTGLALAVVEGVTEANPLGIATIPIKLSMGYVVERGYANDCHTRVQYSKWLGTFFYGATANNISIAFAGAAAPAVGVVVGLSYYLFGEKVDAGAFQCVPDERSKSKK